MKRIDILKLSIQQKKNELDNLITSFTLETKL